MTLDDVRAMEREIITPAIAAAVIGCDPNAIRITAHREPESLGFPVIVVGTRTKIPRRAFIKFMETGGRWFERRNGAENAEAAAPAGGLKADRRTI